MVDCFDCGKELGWKDNKHSKKEIMGLEEQVGFHDELTDRMDEKDRICYDCNINLVTRHALDLWKYNESTLSPKKFEEWKTYTCDSRIFDEAQRLLREENSATETTSETTSNTTSPNQSNMESISADQLRALATSRHDEFKAQWDKNGLVQFKNDKIAILKRMVGQQVQFIVAYDKITEEGYRLMAIDEGITAQGSGFTGGATAYFYFQKMDFVK